MPYSGVKYDVVKISSIKNSSSDLISEIVHRDFRK